MRTSEWIEYLFGVWRENGIRFVVMRGHDKLPDEIDNDLDILFRSDQIELAERVFASAVKEGGGLISNRAAFGATCLYFADKSTGQTFHFDFYDEVSWRGMPLMSVDDVIESAVPKQSWYIPSAEYEAVLCLFTRLLYGGYVNRKYAERIHAAAAQSPLVLKEMIGEIVGHRQSGVVMDHILSLRWDCLDAMANKFRLRIFLRSLRSPGTLFLSLTRDCVRFIKRYAVSPGLIVVLTGPDGCGKTTVGVELKKRMSGLFYEEETQYLHWKPRLLKSKAEAATPFGTPCTDPHGAPLRNRLMNILYFLAHSLEIIPAWMLRVRPKVFRNMLVMIDRYYYDFMVDPRRYRMNVSEKWAWFVYRFMPKPDLVFCLTAPTDVIQARKSEVSPEETDRQRVAYEKVAGRLSYGHVVDTNRPLDQVVDEVESIVVKYLAERVEGRSDSKG